MKQTRTTSATLALGLGLTLGLTAHAQPGFGVRLGESTILHPEVSGSATYNDNVNLRRRALNEGGENLETSDSDFYGNWEASLTLRHWNDNVRLNGRTWLNSRQYFDNTNLDKETYGASGGLDWASHTGRTSAGSKLSWQHAIDRNEASRDDVADSDLSEELEDVAERVERDDLRANINVTQQLLERVRGTLAYSLTEISYDLSDRYNDRTRHLTTTELNNRLTDKTSNYVKLGYAVDEEDGLDKNSENPFAMLGIRTSPTDKLSTDFAVGYEEYTRTPNGGEEENNSGLKFIANVSYAATDKTTVRVSARNGYGTVASGTGNSREEVSASAVLQHQTTRQVTQRFTAAWRQDDYLSPVETEVGPVNEEKETFWLTYRLDYATPSPWLFLFGELSYEDGSSKINGDSYTESQVTLGARARY